VEETDGEAMHRDAPPRPEQEDRDEPSCFSRITISQQPSIEEKFQEAMKRISAAKAFEAAGRAD
jgi:hypothetical protein